MDGPELSDVLKSLRASLAAAQTEGANKALRFAIDDIEVELQVAVTKDADAKVGIKFWVLDANAGGKLGQALTQKIKLKMKVVDTKSEAGAEAAKDASTLIGSKGKK